MNISKYVMRERIIRNIVNGELVKKNIAVIMEEVKLPNNQQAYIPSALNKLLYKKYYNKNINNAKNVGYTICEFLNYVSDMTNMNEDEIFKKLKDEGLYGLNFYHLSSFLNFCIISKNNGYDTIKQKEKRLFEFYSNLIDLGLLNKSLSFKYKMIMGTDNERHKIIISPCDTVEYQVAYPSKNANKVVKLNNLEEYLYQLLIELSEKYTPDITFGIVLQIMSGARKGELVNLRLEDVHLNKDKNRMDLLIMKRPELFTERKIDISSSDVKKPRKQVVFNVDGSLYKYYEHHIKYRLYLLNKNNSFTNALMVDTNGQSMSGSTYVQRFTKLKNIFLKKLKENSYSTYSNIKDTKWGTHICRGIFTNICIQKGYAKNIRDLASLRGDWSEDSSKVYWDTALLAKSINEKVNQINNFEIYEKEDGDMDDCR